MLGSTAIVYHSLVVVLQEMHRGNRLRSDCHTSKTTSAQRQRFMVRNFPRDWCHGQSLSGYQSDVSALLLASLAMLYEVINSSQL